MMAKKKGRPGKNLTPEVLKLRQGLKTLKETNEKLEQVNRILDGEASRVLEEMYEHIQKMDDFLIDLEKRVVALEEEREGGQSEDTATEGRSSKTSEDAEGDLRKTGRGGEEGIRRDTPEGEPEEDTEAEG